MVVFHENDSIGLLFRKQIVLCSPPIFLPWCEQISSVCPLISQMHLHLVSNVKIIFTHWTVSSNILHSQIVTYSNSISLITISLPSWSDIYKSGHAIWTDMWIMRVICNLHIWIFSHIYRVAQKERNGVLPVIKI